PVTGQFVLDDQGDVSFQVGAYDARLPLTIDPVLSYSTYLGGTDSDSGYGIAVDDAGNAYITGETFSSNFPTSIGAYQTSSLASPDVFITKLNASGTGLVYSTYLGGGGGDTGLSI